MHLARLATVKRALAPWGVDPYPATVQKVAYLAVALHAGGYRSAEAYVSAYLVDVERRGGVVTQQMRRAAKDYGRACRRGHGAPLKATALPFERLGDLPRGAERWISGGPVGGRKAMIAGTWLMTREVELSAARARFITIHTAGPQIHVRWTLPASKCDQEAMGVSWSHFCSCTSSSSPSPACVAHALWDQALLLRKRFPARFGDDGRPDTDLPACPDVYGKPVEKSRMVATIVRAAELLGCATSTADGAARITGHTLRVTGAQGLTRRGLDLYTVQILGRWGSLAIQGYVRDAHLLEASKRAASTGAQTVDLDTLIKAVITAMLSTGASTREAVAQVAGCKLQGNEAALEDAVELALTTQLSSEWGLVRNDRSDVLHSVALCAESGPAPRSTACGWKFRSGGPITEFPPGKVPGGTLCERCCRTAPGLKRQSRP